MPAIDEMNDEMSKWLARMDNTMHSYYQAAPVTDWTPHPNSQLADIDFDMGANGPEADPYRHLVADTEIRYDKEYSKGYTVRWSPKRGVFFVYQDGSYVQCHPTRY